jgi:hypothetical protein
MVVLFWGYPAASVGGSDRRGKRAPSHAAAPTIDSAIGERWSSIALMTAARHARSSGQGAERAQRAKSEEAKPGGRGERSEPTAQPAATVAAPRSDP